MWWERMFSKDWLTPSKEIIRKKTSILRHHFEGADKNYCYYPKKKKNKAKEINAIASVSLIAFF